jgi:hypothetical protein
MAKTDNTVQLDSHAAATLSYIRASMDGASLLAVPGSAGIALGIFGFLAALLSSMSGLHEYWLQIWLIASCTGAVVGGVLLVRESSLRGLQLIGTPLRRFAFCLVPSLVAGVVLTLVDWAHGSLHVIPGTWLLLYGCALISASSVTTRTILYLGALFAALGLLAFLLPDELQIAVLAVGFGGLHILFGFLIRRLGHGSQI